jgi:hypothetical protein
MHPSLPLCLLSFMPFDMIISTCEAIDTLLAQREVRLRRPRARRTRRGLLTPPTSNPRKYGRPV